MKELNIIMLLVLLILSNTVTAEVYFDSESGKNIDYYVSENGGILIDKKLTRKYELSFSNKNKQIKKKLIFNYKDEINKEHIVTVDNETKKLSKGFTGKVKIKAHYSDSKVSYTTKTTYSLKNGLIDGELKTHFNEILLQKAAYKNDIANGNETIYWSNGLPAVTGDWNDGYMSGRWTAYYINGKKGLEWSMDKGMLNGVIHAWDISGRDLAIGTYKNTTDKNGKFIFLYGTPIDYIYRVASPIHLIENKNKYTVSNYKNGKVLSTLKVLFKTTQQELNLLKMYLNKNKSNEYATHMSTMLPTVTGQ